MLCILQPKQEVSDVLNYRLQRISLPPHPIQSVRDAFQGLSAWTDEERSTSTYWTTQLFSELRCLAKNLGVVIRSSREPQHSAFLYDVCFLETGGRNPNGNFTPQSQLQRLLLVLECEWKRIVKAYCSILLNFSQPEPNSACLRFLCSQWKV